MNIEHFYLISNNLNFFARSLVGQASLEYGLAQTGIGSRLALLASPESPALNSFEGERSELGEQTMLLGALNPQKVAALCANPESYAASLEKHFVRHLTQFRPVEG
jgi:hypothetical protein